MKRNASLLLLFLLTVICFGQTPAKKVTSSPTQYLGFVLVEGQLWALTTGGNIKVFDVNTGKALTKRIPTNAGILILTKDHGGNIVAGYQNGEIKTFDETKHLWKNVAKSEWKLLGVTFDSQNNPYALTEKGIIELKTGKIFDLDSSLRFLLVRSGGWHHRTAYLLDRHDKLWIGFGHGEWGGGLCIFDVMEKKFLEPNLDSFYIAFNPIKAIFESKNNIYVSSGLQHFSTSGGLAKFDGLKAEKLFYSDTHPKHSDGDKNRELVEGEYIGPATFSEFDNSLYFYSQHGIFKGTIGKDLSRIENWTKVLQPKLHWKSGQPDAIGSPMNVLKLQVLDDGKIIFVSQNDGIGIYNGKTLTMIQ